MKKFLTLLILVLGISYSADAQISQGSWMVGGNAGIDLDPTFIQVNPVLGYFVMENLAVGGNITISKLDGADLQLGIGPFARYYLNNGLFGQIEFTYVDFGDANDTQYGISLGYSYELTENVRIEPILPLDFSDGFNIGVGVGIQAYIFN